MEENIIYRCTYVRKCGWTGKACEKVQKKNEKESEYHGIEVIDFCCPKCGNNSFYVK